MKRRGALVGFVIALALGTAACGSGGSGDAAVSIETLQAAASNSQAAPSSRFTMDMAFDVAGEPTTITVDGVMAGDGKNGELTISMPIVGSIEERVVDGVIYMNLGSFPGAHASSERRDPGWQVDAGRYDVIVARSATEIVATATVTIDD